MSLFSKLIKRGYKPKHPLPEKVWRDPIYFMGFGLGSGAAPVAPGTFGTLAAIPFYIALSYLPLNFYLIFVIGFIIFSSWISDRLSSEIQVHDHPGMNIDEFAGFFVTMIAAPAGIYWILYGFVLFRIFDIFKPWPISYIDKNIHGGFGMILDDVAAGFASFAIIQLTRLFI